MEEILGVPSPKRRRTDAVRDENSSRTPVAQSEPPRRSGSSPPDQSVGEPQQTVAADSSPPADPEPPVPAEDPRIIRLPDGTTKKRRGRLPGSRAQPHWKKPGRKPKSQAQARYFEKAAVLQLLLATQLTGTLVDRKEQARKRDADCAAALLSVISARAEARLKAVEDLAEDETPVAFTIQVRWVSDTPQHRPL